jgi:hypothetical protein
MKMKEKSGQKLIVLLALVSGISLILPWNASNSEANNWVTISSYFERFLEDPEANFFLLEKIEDLYYWTGVYEELNEKDYVEQVLSKQFQANDIDATRIHILFSLLLKYSSPSVYYGPIRGLVRRIVDIAREKPEWFAGELLKRPDHKEILRLAVYADIDSILKERQGLKEVLSNMSSPELVKMVTSCLQDIENEERTQLQYFELFVEEPAGYYERIKDVHNLCSMMGKYDSKHRNENKVLQPEDNSILRICQWVSRDTDENKLSILLHLLCHCDSAYHGEVAVGCAEKIFMEDPRLFARTLEKQKYWRSIVLKLSCYMGSSEKELVIKRLGGTEYEERLKDVLIFLSNIISNEIH